MPIYSLQDIQALVEADAWNFGTRRSADKARSYGYTRDDVRDCLLSLEIKHFRKEFGDADSDYGTIKTDDYRIEYDGLSLYIKFGIHEDDEGQLCVVVSFHTN